MGKKIRTEEVDHLFEAILCFLRMYVRSMNFFLCHSVLR